VLTERDIALEDVVGDGNPVEFVATDRGEADDKIVAVLDNDQVMSGIADIRQLPSPLLHRLRHYFSTYKMVPGEPSPMVVEKVYGVEEAYKVVRAAMADYDEEFGQGR